MRTKVSAPGPKDIDHSHSDQAIRPRRLRRTAAMRRLTAEKRLETTALVQPLFVRDGLLEAREIASMPGVFQHSLESAVKAARAAVDAGVGGLILFGIPSEKDQSGEEASDPNGIMQRAIRAIISEVGEKMVVIGDINLDEYTAHGHSGVLGEDGDVDNDKSIRRFAEVAVAQANAGVHMVAPSGMMDGQVAAIRKALDASGHHSVGIMAYAAKYASSFYGPFRSAVESSLSGDRKTYQQYSGNIKEAIREVLLDVEEGADIIMVKPALPYLDIISKVSESIHLPVAAYQVSGEYVMVESAASLGKLDRTAMIKETLLSIQRAGASIILTYWATEAALLFKREADD